MHVDLRDMSRQLQLDYSHDLAFLGRQNRADLVEVCDGSHVEGHYTLLAIEHPQMAMNPHIHTQAQLSFLSGILQGMTSLS